MCKIFNTQGSSEDLKYQYVVPIGNKTVLYTEKSIKRVDLMLSSSQNFKNSIKKHFLFK